MLEVEDEEHLIEDYEELAQKQLEAEARFYEHQETIEALKKEQILAWIRANSSVGAAPTDKELSKAHFEALLKMKRDPTPSEIAEEWIRQQQDKNNQD